MKIASMDIGTNSIRLMNGIMENGKIRVVDKFVIITRIGEGVNETGLLSDEGMNRSVDALFEHKKNADAFGAEEIYVMATSAVRDAANREVFLRRVKDEVGLEIEVISGDLEAEIGFQGVLLGSEEKDLLVIDIGGGSTELILGDQSGIKYAKSSDVGVVRMTGKHIESDPIKEDEYMEMVSDVEEILADALSSLKNASYKKFIGIGGTASTFITMKKEMAVFNRDIVHNSSITLEEISTMVAKLKGMTLEEKKKIVGLEEKRADVILAGGVILETAMRVLSIPKMVVSVSDNLDGWAYYKKIYKKDN